MEVYRKKSNGRYESIGYEWTGFPSNGIWLVKDGTQNCLVQMRDICTKPRRYQELVEHQDDCIDFIQMKSKENGGYSLNEISRWAAEFYATILGHEDEV